MDKNTILFYQYGQVEIVEGRGMPKFPYQTHESFLIGVIKSGVVYIKIGSDSYTLKEGDTYVVPSGFGMSITPCTPYSYLTICIKDEYKNILIPQAGIFQDLGSRIYKLCSEIYLNKDTGKFVIALADILKGKLPSETLPVKQPDYAVVSDIKNYIDTHIEDKILLDDISSEIHVSKFHLVRIFRSVTGIPPMHYLMQSRLRHAKSEILSGKSLKEVAYDLNFSAQSHLCTAFKKYMGISIVDYKKSVIKNEQ